MIVPMMDVRIMVMFMGHGLMDVPMGMPRGVFSDLEIVFMVMMHAVHVTVAVNDQLVSMVVIMLFREV